MRSLAPITKEYDLTHRKCALRWLAHHRLLSGGEQDDTILMGAENAESLEENLSLIEKGPLSDKVIRLLNKAWEMVCETRWIKYEDADYKSEISRSWIFHY